MIRVIFLKKEISKNLKIARGNLQLISHLPKSMSGTTVILGSKYPQLHHALNLPNEVFLTISDFKVDIPHKQTLRITLVGNDDMNGGKF